MTKKVQWLFEATFPNFVFQRARVRVGTRPGICSLGFISHNDGYECASGGMEFDLCHKIKESDMPSILKLIKTFGSGRLFSMVPDSTPRTLYYPQPINHKIQQEWTLEGLKLQYITPSGVIDSETNELEEFDITWTFGKVRYRSFANLFDLIKEGSEQ